MNEFTNCWCQPIPQKDWRIDRAAKLFGVPDAFDRMNACKKTCEKILRDYKKTHRKFFGTYTIHMDDRNIFFIFKPSVRNKWFPPTKSRIWIDFTTRIRRAQADKAEDLPYRKYFTVEELLDQREEYEHQLNELIHLMSEATKEDRAYLNEHYKGHRDQEGTLMIIG